MSIATDIQNLALRYPDIAERAYPHRCSIVRDTDTKDGRGGWTTSPSTIADDLPCTFVPRGTNQREVIVGGKPVGMADGDIWLQAQLSGSSLTVKEQDRIVIEALESDPEKTYEVIFAAPHQGILFQVAVRLIGNG